MKVIYSSRRAKKRYSFFRVYFPIRYLSLVVARIICVTWTSVLSCSPIPMRYRNGWTKQDGQYPLAKCASCYKGISRANGLQPISKVQIRRLNGEKTTCQSKGATCRKLIFTYRLNKYLKCAKPIVRFRKIRKYEYLCSVIFFGVSRYIFCSIALWITTSEIEWAEKHPLGFVLLVRILT